MAKTLIWSDASLQDIDDIAEYISRDSIYYAQKVVEQIFAVGELFVEQPRLGRIVPELKQDFIREGFVYSYRIIYAIGKQTIEILAVIHGNRLLESIEGRFAPDN